jgi:hypothetical protein
MQSAVKTRIRFPVSYVSGARQYLLYIWDNVNGVDFKPKFRSSGNFEVKSVKSSLRDQYAHYWLARGGKKYTAGGLNSEPVPTTIST